MGKIFLISDTHFWHDNIVTYCGRPFEDGADMTEKMIGLWNERVGADDEVYVVGDFILGDPKLTEETLMRLNGHIVLVRGNHDTKAKLDVYARHPDKIEVRDMAYIPYKGVWFVLCHFPLTNPEFLAMVQQNNSEVVVVHGHVHNKMPFYTKEYHSFNVSADVVDFRPVPLHHLWELVREDFMEKGVWRGK